MKILGLLALLLPTSGFAFASADPTLAKTASGLARGTSDGKIVSFLGLPYAAAPVGKLRWAPPASPESWPGVREASSFGNICPQPSAMPFAAMRGNEDCLSLNVWRPLSAEGLPVMVFIHGGGNSMGSSHDLGGISMYDGSALANKGPAVVVTINYRLGALGFLAHPDLARERADHSVGNYALLDQIQALRWVRDNITAFGGDPANVTVFGESAGAIDILALLASPLSRGLFHRAIVESGFLTEVPLADAEEAGAKYAEKLGCSDATCLRSKSAEELVAASSAGPGKLAAFANTIDGVVLPTGVLAAFRAHRAHPVPLIIGTNADEMTTLLPVLNDVKKSLTDKEYATQLEKDLGKDVARKVLAQYPVSKFNTPYDAYLHVATDSFSHCPARRLARSFAGPVFRYVFTHVSDNPFLAPYGAGHGLELPFVFHANSSLFSQKERDLSDQFLGYWTTFARTGNPNAQDLPVWEARTPGDDYLQLDNDPVSKTGFREAECDFWDSVAT